MTAVLLAVLAGCGSGTGPVVPPSAGPPRDVPVPVVPAVPAGSWTPWPAALHDARHSGSSPVDGPTDGTVRWRRRLEGPVAPGPVVGADGTVYVASNAGILHALDPGTGADRWTYDARTRLTGADLSTSALVLPDGTVLWGPPGARSLVALSPTGSVRWTQPLPGRPTSPTSADGRRVYVGDTSGGVTALDVDGASHTQAWTTTVGTTSYGSVVTDGAGRLYTTADSALVALDDRGATVGEAWRADPGDDITEVSAGLAPDGTALLGTNGTREWAYRPDGSLRWTAPRVITYSSPSVTPGGLAYVADHSGRVHVLRIADGTSATVLAVMPVAQIWSSVSVDQAHRAYLGTQDGRLLGFGPDGGVLFDVRLAGPVDSYPALTGDGAVVVGDRGGDVVAVGRGPGRRQS